MRSITGSIWLKSVMFHKSIANILRRSFIICCLLSTILLLSYEQWCLSLSTIGWLHRASSVKHHEASERIAQHDMKASFSVLPITLPPACSIQQEYCFEPIISFKAIKRPIVLFPLHCQSALLWYRTNIKMCTEIKLLVVSDDKTLDP